MNLVPAFAKNGRKTGALGRVLHWLVAVVGVQFAALNAGLMSQELADSLNLELAWARLKFDRPDRCFLSHPFLLQLVELNLATGSKLSAVA